jgi:hypothetical protein
MCVACPDNLAYQTSPWFDHIWMIYQMQQAGYPFEKNDLELTEWLALTEMKQAVETPPESQKR